MPSKLFFLPGASGNTRFWVPVADLLTHPAEKVHFGWPGFGATPPDRNVRGFGDLVAKVIAEIDSPTALIAQSMGGIIAVLAALEKPELITHLVLTVTSGGIDMESHGAQDWRPSFHQANPSVPQWFSTCQQDLTLKLPEIAAPVLLLWGDSDPISPISAGQQLAALLPNAKLHVFAGGDHDLANNRAGEIAPLIDRFLLN